ncbi:hypothetical protein ACFL2Q_09220 [Thermodesulfobacteriota bacterium]
MFKKVLGLSKKPSLRLYYALDETVASHSQRLQLVFSEPENPSVKSLLTSVLKISPDSFDEIQGWVGGGPGVEVCSDSFLDKYKLPSGKLNLSLVRKALINKLFARDSNALKLMKDSVTQGYLGHRIRSVQALVAQRPPKFRPGKALTVQSEWHPLATLPNGLVVCWQASIQISNLDREYDAESASEEWEIDAELFVGKGFRTGRKNPDEIKKLFFARGTGFIPPLSPSFKQLFFAPQSAKRTLVLPTINDELVRMELEFADACCLFLLGKRCGH